MKKQPVILLVLLVSIVGVLTFGATVGGLAPALAQMPPALSGAKTAGPSPNPGAQSSPALTEPTQPQKAPAPPTAGQLQQDPTSAAPSSASASAQPAAPLWWSNQNAMTISVVVLAFGAITILIAAYLIRAERDGQVILRILATISIITFAVFLIVAGYSDQQIAPAMGLLGTIAGYLLGKESRPRDQNPERPAS